MACALAFLRLVLSVVNADLGAVLSRRPCETVLANADPGGSPAVHLTLKDPADGRRLAAAEANVCHPQTQASALPDPRLRSVVWFPAPAAFRHTDARWIRGSTVRDLRALARVAYLATPAVANPQVLHGVRESSCVRA